MTPGLYDRKPWPWHLSLSGIWQMFSVQIYKFTYVSRLWQSLSENWMVLCNSIVRSGDMGAISEKKTKTKCKSYGTQSYILTLHYIHFEQYVFSMILLVLIENAITRNGKIFNMFCELQSLTSKKACSLILASHQDNVYNKYSYIVWFKLIITRQVKFYLEKLQTYQYNDLI